MLNDPGREAVLVVRLFLSSDDLGRVRLLPSADPLEELILAAHDLSGKRTDPVWGGWARRTISAMGPVATPLMHVMNSAFVQVSDLTASQPNAGRSFDDALESVLSSPQAKWRSEVEYLAGFGIAPGPAAAIADGQPGAIDRFGKVLRRFHAASIASYWPAMSLCALAGRDACMRLLAEGGVGSLLNGLHPQVSWNSPVLTLQLKQCGSANCSHVSIAPNIAPVGVFEARGRGLDLVPSIFAENLALRVPADDENEPFQLAFPVPVDWQVLSDPKVSLRDPLADLMGSTRSLVLQALGEREYTTSNLARALRISAASASEHASVLRDAHLLTSTREGNQVKHRLSALGATLVHSTRH